MFVGPIAVSTRNGFTRNALCRREPRAGFHNGRCRYPWGFPQSAAADLIIANSHQWAVTLARGRAGTLLQGIAAGRGPPDGARLPIALLVARDFDVVGVNVGAKSGDLVSAQRVGARDDAAAAVARS